MTLFVEAHSAAWEEIADTVLGNNCMEDPSEVVDDVADQSSFNKKEKEQKIVHFVCKDLCQRWDHNIDFLFSVDSFLGGEVHTRSGEWGSSLRHFLKFCINSHSVKCVTGKPVCTQIILMFDEGFHLL